MITFMPMLMWVAALVGAGASLYVSAHSVTPSNIGRSLLRWLFIFPLGAQGLWDFVTYGFLPQTMADQFGWAPSPFQMEVAFANLGLAAASFFAAFSKRPARMAVALVAACYLVGSGLSLVNNILDGDDLAAGVAGAILLQNFLTPVVVLLLLFLGPQTEEAGATETRSDAAQAPRGLQPQPAPNAPPPQRALPAPSRPQEPSYGQPSPAYGQDDPFGPQELYGLKDPYGQQDPLGPKAASGLHERAPWEAPSNPAPSTPPRGNPARSNSSPPKPAPASPASQPSQQPRRSQQPRPPQQPQRPSAPPPALPRPQPPVQPQPRYDDFDQSLEDELERARRQLMDDLQKGRKPGDYSGDY
ncbi:DUF6790 family protein [Methyloligella solikamskensis]|uniref:DUF6790 family protein n=1 Tax=Methyloligella solikamskensis TaxID=1177756 RepID=A0ABW3J8S0_9HYPH